MNKLELYEKSRHTDSGIRFIGLTQSDHFSLHWHEHLEIHFLLRGNASIRCGSQMIHFKENDCLIINSNELHEGFSVNRYESFKFKLHPSFLDHKHYIFDHLVHDDTVINLMHKIIALHQNTDDASIFLVKGYTFQLMGHLCMHYSAKSPYAGNQQQNSEKLQKMNTIASFMHLNFTAEIRTETLAEMSHYNYSHFCHTFKEVFGISATRYLLSIRMNKASALLSTTDMNITEIAAASGFSDANYFARIFKKETGLSPSQYREKIGQSSDNTMF